MPDLPEKCVNEGPPFLHTGENFTGPLYVKDLCSADKETKVYITLFTCMYINKSSTFRDDSRFLRNSIPASIQKIYK